MEALHVYFSIAYNKKTCSLTIVFTKTKAPVVRILVEQIGTTHGDTKVTILSKFNNTTWNKDIK